MEHLSYSRIQKKYYNTKMDMGTIHEMLSEEIKKNPLKLVVLDDDPTGVQSVHDVSVYTDWSVESIKIGFSEKEKLFYILTNSRALTEDETVRIHREIAQNIVIAAREAKASFAVISRGDSTLRGHFPLETRVLRDELMENGGKAVDAEIIIPYFKDGGRFTIGDVHYVKYGDELVPAGETEFAQDKTFGYKSSDLKEYIEEKTKGEFKASDVISISLEELRGDSIKCIEDKLMSAVNFQKVIVNALDEDDMEVFCTCLYKAIAKGKNFQFRTAADFVKCAGGINNKPLLNRGDMIKKRSKAGGIVIIGSHTKKTTNQLEALKDIKDLVFMEFDSDLVLEDRLDAEVEEKVSKAEEYITKGKTVVIYTKRKLLSLENDTKEKALTRSVKISEAVQRLVGSLKAEPAFVVAKGGITSSDIGVKALKVRRARVLGQVEKGIPVWQTDDKSKFPKIPYIIFPGNVGEDDTLKRVLEKLI